VSSVMNMTITWKVFNRILAKVFRADSGWFQVNLRKGYPTKKGTWT
jgi:hypothetical protein